MINEETSPKAGYEKKDIASLREFLGTCGFSLDEKQPHLGGERYLWSHNKFVLNGKESKTGRAVVIKASNTLEGKREITRERVCREALPKIKFAHHVFFSPEEIFFTEEGEYMISIVRFIEQERPFLERTLQEQFFIALKAFEAQEGAHATAYSHRRDIDAIFETVSAKQYLSSFETYAKTVLFSSENATLSDIFLEARESLADNLAVIEKYADFLVHWDFVPHNFRLLGRDIYLLDHSSIRFGNKYEGWARFINFMALYHPELENALLFYVKNNRSAEEYLVLRLMRVYRLGELIWHHHKIFLKADGAMRELSKKRVEFWTKVLEAVLKDKMLSKDILEEYKKTRDELRSEDEKNRQIGLH